MYDNRMSMQAELPVSGSLGTLETTFLVSMFKRWRWDIGATSISVVYIL